MLVGRTLRANRNTGGVIYCLRQVHHPARETVPNLPT